MNSGSNIVYLLVRGSDRNWLNIVKELEDELIAFNLVDAEKNGMEYYLWRDYRTFDLPILVTKNRIVKGEAEIISFIRKILSPLKNLSTGVK